MSLLSRVLVLVGVSLLPAVAIQGYNEVRLRQDRAREAETEVLHRAQLLNADLASIVDGAQQLGAAISRFATVRALSPECAEPLRNVRAEFSRYHAITVYDATGRAICTTVDTPTAALTADEGVRAALEDGRFVTGHFHADGSGTGHLPFIYPMRGEDGAIRGAVEVELSLAWLGERIASVERATDSTVVVADDRGIILARYPDSANWMGKPFLGPIMQYLTAPGPGTAVVPGFDGKERLIGYIPPTVEPRGLWVSVGLYMPAVLAEINRGTWRSVGVSLVGVTLATLLALLAGLPVIRAPTTRLLAAAARWRQGDLSARVAVAGSPRSEFAQLGAAFNDMAEALEARDRALREAEARELGRARELSRMLVENSVQGIIAYDRHLNVLAWNPAMAALSKVPAEAAIGRPLMDVVPPLRGSESEAAMRAALAGRDHAVRDALMEVGGRRLHLESDHRPLRDGDGAVIGGIAFVRDVTLEREAEAKSRQAQRLEAVGQLTGGVAHDFNNLLQVVTGNLALALRRAEDGPLRRQLQSAAAAAERGAQLTGQLLAFARRQPLSPQSVDTPALLARLAEMLGRTLGPNYAVTARTGPGVWPVRADPGQIELALLNLALNARDAMPEGGRIELSAVNLTDAPGDLPRGEYVRIAVADDGPGMTEAVAARAFEPFFTTKPAGKGTGLGLSMVYGFSRQSGGTAVLETAPGRGLTVAMLLPRAAMAAAEPAPPPAAPTGGSGARVLVVDDDAAVREVAVALLADLGLEVAAADGGPSALDRLAAGERFDFAVFDVAMPGMNGVEAARRARALQPGLPVLFVTGHADLAVLQGVKDPVLRKPYTAEALAGAVRSLLEGRPPAIQSA